MTLKKMDHDKDGRVSFGDFQMTVKNDPLMMEAFGPCLPNSALGESLREGYKVRKQKIVWKFPNLGLTPLLTSFRATLEKIIYSP